MSGTADPHRSTDATSVQARLEDAGVAAVVLGFVDPSAIVRVKSDPDRPVRARSLPRVSGLSTLFNVAMSNDQFALLPGYIDGPSGDLRLRPDPAATVPLAAMPGWAWAPVDQFTQEGEPFPACPRAFARRMADAFTAAGVVGAGGVRVRVLGRDRTRATDAFGRPTKGPATATSRSSRNHDFALDLITTMEAQGLGPAAVPSRVRRRPVRDVDRPSRPGRRRRRRDGGAPDGARRRPAARARRVVRSAGRPPTRATARTLHLSLWEERPQPAGRRRRSGRHAPARRGVRRRAPARAAGARRRDGADLPGLPAPAAPPLVGRDAVLGHGEPRGRRCGSSPAPREATAQGGERRDQAGRRHGESLPRGRRAARGRLSRPRRRRSAAAVDRGGSGRAVPTR